MQINNNREMRALEDKRRALIKELDAATDLYTEAVKGFMLCQTWITMSAWADGQRVCNNGGCQYCNGTGWVKK